jgi:uncharacterized protein (TIGR03083 family)
MKAVEPVLTTALFPKLLAKLVTLLESLSPEEWDKPTICAPWTVKDLAAHLLGDEFTILSRARDNFSYAGEPVRTWEELVQFIDWQNERWVEAAKRFSTPVLIDLLKHAGGQVNDYFKSVDPFESGHPVEWTGKEPAPKWLGIAREYTERWVHQQQIWEALDKPGITEPDLFKPVLAAFVLALPYTYRDVPATEGISVTLKISGEAGGIWTIVMESDNWKLYEGTPDKPTAEVSLPEVIAWRLFTRNISPVQALGFASLKGDRELGLTALQMVSIIVQGD